MCHNIVYKTAENGVAYGFCGMHTSRRFCIFERRFHTIFGILQLYFKKIKKNIKKHLQN